MAQLIADRRDIDFVLYNQLHAEKLCKHESYSEFNPKAIALIIDESRHLATREILPTLAKGDQQGIRFENGVVRLPECFHRAYQLMRKGEWIGMAVSSKYGGQGMPHLVAQAASEYQLGANHALFLGGWGGIGAGNMIEAYGTEFQKRIYLEKLYTGGWTGTMAMTEPQAGSDVGALTTTAKALDNGTFAITGNKVFISGGDHDLTENIIHMVLARIEGAPAGTKGLSLFIVPKIWVNSDGSLGAENDVICTGIEDKLGIHGSPTCSLSFGGSGECRGLLLGEENKGMRVMFHMMNAARLIIGATASACASAAYIHAVNYARERHQGRDLEKIFDPDAPQVPIIQHPDVRRMLMEMKAYTEGMRSLVYYGAWLLDGIHCANDSDEKSERQATLDLLTPIIKAYCSDRAFEVCSQAVQVYGGYGYIRDYPVEQLLRDVRVTSIFEGTNGVQAMDLLGRKLRMQNGKVFENLISMARETVVRARKDNELKVMADKLDIALNRLTEVAGLLGQTVSSHAFRTAFAHATPFLEVMGDIILAWMLLWRAVEAKSLLEKQAKDITGSQKVKSKDTAFYIGQIKTAQFFIGNLLPVAMGKMDAIASGENTVVEMPEPAFGA